MGTEILLYGYGIVCISMIVFNIVYMIILRGSEYRLERRSGKFEKRIQDQVERISNGEKAEERHFSYMRRKLSRVNNLIAFDGVMDDCDTLGDTNPAMAQYMEQMQPLILYLAAVYKKRDNLQAAYFAYFVGRHKLKKHMSVDSVQNILIDYMKKNSLYCRINTLYAFYSFGSADKIVEAIMVQDRSGSFIHEKILTDGLLSYTGDHAELIKLLWEKMDNFTERTQHSVLNYIRFKSGDYCEKMFEIMNDKTKDKELRIAAIRYFGRYNYAPAKEKLIGFLRDKNMINWEYAAASALALSIYDGEDSTDALFEAMHSSNWYVRYNSAVSIENLNVDNRKLMRIISGKDRYAREMLLYRMDSQRIEAVQGRA